MNKKFLIVILFLIPLFTFAQSKKSIDGFLDIPFGSDSATVKAAMIVKGAVKDHMNTTKDVIAFLAFNMSERRVHHLFVHFVDNKAYEAYFVFDDLGADDALTYYNNFSIDITAVYGKGKMTDNFGDLSNTAKIRKLISGNASCETLWQSKNKNKIDLSFQPFNNSLQVILDYQSDSLWNLSAAKKRADL